MSWIVPPGSLIPKPRLTPNGKVDDGRSDAWMRLNTPRAARMLQQEGLVPTPAAVTVVLLKEFLLPAAWANEERRREWLEFLLPTVEETLRGAKL